MGYGLVVSSFTCWFDRMRNGTPIYTIPEKFPLLDPRFPIIIPILVPYRSASFELGSRIRTGSQLPGAQFKGPTGRFWAVFGGRTVGRRFTWSSWRFAFLEFVDKQKVQSRERPLFFSAERASTPKSSLLTFADSHLSCECAKYVLLYQSFDHRAGAQR